MEFSCGCLPGFREVPAVIQQNRCLSIHTGQGLAGAGPVSAKKVKNIGGRVGKQERRKSQNPKP